MKLIITIALLTIVSPQYQGKETGCEKLHVALSTSNSFFIRCVGDYAVPVNICIECVSQYNAMNAAYNNLLEGVDNNGTKCAPKYVDNDRLNIIINTELSFRKIWNDAFCSECFDANGTISNETEQFRRSAVSYKNCKELYLKNNQYCEHCKESYESLNVQYKNIKAEHKDMVCFDLKDDMNRTRSDWTKICGHERPKASLVVFGAVSSVLSTIPLIFYCGFFMYTRRSERNHQILTADLQAEPGQRPDQNNDVPSTSREMPSTSNVADPETVTNINKLNLGDDDLLVDLE